MRVLVLLLTALSLAACATDNAVRPCCTGPAFPLNPGAWSPTDADLAL
jgi:hypothetical protein